MKSLVLSIFVLFITFLPGYAQDNKPWKFSFTDSACVVIMAESITDTLKAELYYFTSIPYASRFMHTIVITKQGKHMLRIGITRPAMAYFKAGERFQIYLVPGDTVVIKTGFAKSNAGKDNINCQVSNPYQDYYQAKKQKLGYYSFFDLPDSLEARLNANRKIGIHEYVQIIKLFDSLTLSNKAFLSEFRNLPDWFVESENADIIYSASMKIQRSYLRIHENEREKIFFAEPEINNPSARYSSYYYEFLSAYLYNKVNHNLLSFDPKTWYLNRAKTMAGLIDSLLTGEIREYYSICHLADLFSMCKTKDDLKNAEEFAASWIPGLKEDQKEFLNAVKKKFVKLNLQKNDPAPDFYLKNENNQFIRLSDLKGKPVYINFWGNNCNPCIAELSSINQIFKKYSEKGLQIVNIFLDNEEADWRKTINSYQLKGINLICKGNWATNLKNSYFIEEVPHFVLIDKTGKIICNKCENHSMAIDEIKKLL
jgi:peroxiredoxin